MASNAETIYQALRGYGFGLPQTAAIMANLLNESSYSTTASGDGGSAIGIAQWEGPRRTALRKLAAERHTSETDLNTQLAYLFQELNGPYKHIVVLMNSSNDPATLARYWDVGPGGPRSGTGYENSSGSTTSKRVNDAVSIYTQLQDGKVPTGGGNAEPYNPTDVKTQIQKSAPFPPTGLHVPLTTAERHRMFAWLETFAGSGDSHPERYALAAVTGDDWRDYQTSTPPLYAIQRAKFDKGEYDAQLIRVYASTYNAAPIVPPGYQYDLSTKYSVPGVSSLVDWTKSLGKVLGWLTQVKNWERIGLFVLGAVILLFAAIFLFTQSSAMPDTIPV